MHYPSTENAYKEVILKSQSCHWFVGQLSSSKAYEDVITVYDLFRAY